MLIVTRKTLGLSGPLGDYDDNEGKMMMMTIMMMKTMMVTIMMFFS